MDTDTSIFPADFALRSVAADAFNRRVCPLSFRLPFPLSRRRSIAKEGDGSGRGQSTRAVRLSLSLSVHSIIAGQSPFSLRAETRLHSLVLVLGSPALAFAEKERTCQARDASIQHIPIRWLLTEMNSSSTTTE